MMKATIYTGNPDLFVLQFEGTDATVIDAFLRSCEDVMSVDGKEIAITDSFIYIPVDEPRKPVKVATLVTLLELQNLTVKLRIGKKAPALVK